jgi:hypothetical protein
MREDEIRPKHIFGEYLRLAERDTKNFFSPTDRQTVLCPACDAHGIRVFTKQSFAYEECPDCQTLFVSPRPTAEAFSRYYQESESAIYWATTFYKETAEIRREKLWRPKALMIHGFINEFGSTEHAVIDIGGGYGIFAEEYKKIFGKKVMVIEPGPALAEVCRDKGHEVVQNFLEDIEPEQLGAGPKAFVSFELFEHLHDIKKFLRHLHKLMNNGDLFAFTTLSGTGVDIQALWEDSEAISPPHHLNFLNPKSIQILLEHSGFEVLKISTPGKLDIDILCSHRQHIKDRFWRTFAIQATADEKKVIQTFISENGLSSHMLAICKKL